MTSGLGESSIPSGEPKKLNLKLTFPDGKRRLVDDTDGTNYPGEEAGIA
jgi:hypothetical protein